MPLERSQECPCCCVPGNPVGSLKAQLDRPLLTEPLGDFWGAAFWGLPRPTMGVPALSTQQPGSLWKHSRTNPRAPGLRGPSRLPSLLPFRLCLPHPGLVFHLSFPLSTRSQPQKTDFPCACPEPSVFLGITLALVFFSGSHCPCLWCHRCARGAFPPPTHTHRTARANTSGRRPGPGSGDAGSFCVSCEGPEAW